MTMWRNTRFYIEKWASIKLKEPVVPIAFIVHQLVNQLSSSFNQLKIPTTLKKRIDETQMS